MRTTITISDDLYREVKAVAARSARTVSQLIEDAVRAELRGPQQSARDLAPLPVFGSSGVLPGVDLYGRSSLAEVLDSGTTLDALR